MAEEEYWESNADENDKRDEEVTFGFPILGLTSNVSIKNICP